MSVSVTIDDAGIRALIAPGGPVYNDLFERALRVEGRAKILAPVDTGRMRAAGYTAPSREVEGAWDVVFPVSYTIFVHNGTRFMAARPFLVEALPAAVE